MDIEFKEIDFEHDFVKCFEFRKDSYICSFGGIDGFKESIQGTKKESVTEWIVMNGSI